MNSLRIDAAIKPSSYLRLLLYVALASIFILLAWLADLSLLQYIILLMIVALAVAYLALSRPILLHISQPPLSQRLNQGWQLLVRSGLGDTLWQAELITVRRYQLLIHLQFKIVEPYNKLFSVTIFRDQLDPLQWRALNVLSTVTHIQSS